MRDTMWRGIFGEVLTAFWGRSVYLDDHTSFTEVSGNIFVDASAYHIFFHSGSNNTVENNVFVNGSLQNPGTQILLKRINHNGRHLGDPFAMRGNSLNRNIFLAPPNFTKFISGDAAADGAWANATPYISSVQNNLYFRPSHQLNSSEPLFFALDWVQWRQKGWDAGSLLNVDPRFEDAAAGDFRLKSGHPAIEKGFKPLDYPMCRA
eukprot:SAG31_NODE_982_length_10556_cov_18.203883_3_plen_207_part_00